MSTDLFGTPLGKAPAFELNLHQRRQATLLHHWTSNAYLEGLLALIDGLMKGVDVNLTLACVQARDDLIANDQWGVRDTAANWGSLAWPALADFKQSTMRLLGWRSGNLYCGTGLSHCDRMLSELSPYWMTPDEKTWFDAQWKIINDYTYCLDQAIGVGGRRPLRDVTMASQWEKLSSNYPQLPVFKVHTDREFSSSEMPGRTGVYVPVDDPYGTLQFAWTGSDEGALGPCMTFSPAGLDVLRQVGRARMWIDRSAMVSVVGPMYAHGHLRDRGPFSPEDELDEDCVNSVISKEVFTSRPCKWYFVEKLEGQLSSESEENASSDCALTQDRLRCEAGQPCPRNGEWETHAQVNSRRRFKQGEVMPSVEADYGQTIWQWVSDSNV